MTFDNKEYVTKESIATLIDIVKEDITSMQNKVDSLESTIGDINSVLEEVLSGEGA